MMHLIAPNEFDGSSYLLIEIQQKSCKMQKSGKLNGFVHSTKQNYIYNSIIYIYVTV